MFFWGIGKYYKPDLVFPPFIGIRSSLSKKYDHFVTAASHCLRCLILTPAGAKGAIIIPPPIGRDYSFLIKLAAHKLAFDWPACHALITDSP